MINSCSLFLDTLSVSFDLCLRHVYNPSPDEKMRARWQSRHSNGISFPQGVKVHRVNSSLEEELMLCGQEAEKEHHFSPQNTDHEL